MNEEIRAEVKDIKNQISSIGTDIRIAMSVSDKRINARNVIIAALLSLLILSNVGWLMYERQFETVDETTTTETTTTKTYTIDQDNENGSNNYIGRDGNISYGQAKDYSN